MSRVFVIKWLKQLTLFLYQERFVTSEVSYRWLIEQSSISQTVILSFIYIEHILKYYTMLDAISNIIMLCSCYIPRLLHNNANGCIL